MKTNNITIILEKEGTHEEIYKEIVQICKAAGYGIVNLTIEKMMRR